MLASKADGKEHKRHFERELDYKRRSAERIHHAEMLGGEPFTPVLHPGDMHVDSMQAGAAVNEPLGELGELDRQQSDVSDNERGNTERTEALGDRPLTPLLKPNYTQGDKVRGQSVNNGPFNETRKKQRGRSERKRNNLQSSATTGDPLFKSFPSSEHEDVDSKHGRIIAKGPSSEFKRKQWANSEIERHVIESAIEELETVRVCPEEDLEDGNSQVQVAAQLDYWTELLARLDAFYPSAKQRRQPGFDLQQWQQQRIRDDWECPIFRLISGARSVFAFQGIDASCVFAHPSCTSAASGVQ